MTRFFYFLRGSGPRLRLPALQILAEGGGESPGTVIVLLRHGPALTSSEVSGHSAGLPESDRLP